jgi:hypothetical protein
MTTVLGAVDATLTILSKHITGQQTYSKVVAHLGQLPGDYVEIGVSNGIGAHAIAYQFPLKKVYAINKPGATTSDDQKIIDENLSEIKNISWIVSAINNITDKQINDITASWITINGGDDVAEDLELAMRLIGKRQCIVAINNISNSDVQTAFNNFVNQQDQRLVYIAMIDSNNSVLMDLKSVE